MHTVQDHYAHEEQGAGWLAHRPIVGTDPDNRLKHPDEFATAGAATRLYRARYKAALKKRKAEQNQQQAKKKDKRKQKPLSNSSTNCGAENSGAECSGGLK
jgi:hypothetical protein